MVVGCLGWFGSLNRLTDGFGILGMGNKQIVESDIGQGSFVVTISGFKFATEHAEVAER